MCDYQRAVHIHRPKNIMDQVSLTLLKNLVKCSNSVHGRCCQVNTFIMGGGTIIVEPGFSMFTVLC